MSSYNTLSVYSQSQTTWESTSVSGSASETSSIGFENSTSVTPSSLYSSTSSAPTGVIEGCVNGTGLCIMQDDELGAHASARLPSMVLVALMSLLPVVYMLLTQRGLTTSDLWSTIT
ncbi:hypothetical protein MAR_015308 [Mya arenaria]|uniref:Uncharacterized protein n=1 Tax=Mya arenaria TaxID=6604 RepID=A0ABY7FKD3_MYAAR|nr:hypothetical protein MAR_015308 [Mya arenaria]